MPIDSKIKNLMGKDKKTVTQLARELPDVSSISQAEEANIMGEEKFKIFELVKHDINSQAPERARNRRARYAITGTKGEGEVRSLRKLNQSFWQC